MMTTPVSLMLVRGSFSHSGAHRRCEPGSSSTSSRTCAFAQAPPSPASPRTRGSITTDANFLRRLERRRDRTTRACGYGSLRSQGRRVAISTRRANHYSDNRKLIICPVLAAKIFCFSEMANHSRMAPILTRQEGRYANVSNVGQVAVDVGGFLDD